MNALLGKKALVTGGSRGIGAACALDLARAGADVAIGYLNSPQRAEQTAAGIREHGRAAAILRADMGEAADASQLPDRVVDQLGGLDIVVNNAGIFPTGPFADVTLSQLDETLAVHTKAPFLTTQSAATHLGRDGRVINIGSTLAQRAPYPDIALYATSKSSLVGMTKALARELGPRGITVNVVHPGSTATEMNPPDSAEADGERELTALGRYAEPADIAAMVTHLAGPGGRNITGTEISVDSGFGA